MSEYQLKNGEKVIIRYPKEEDAMYIVHLIKNADKETIFLAREPGEFSITVEKEKDIIQNILEDSDSAWFVAEYRGKVIGQCSVGLVRKNLRYRHRAEVGFVVLKKYWNLGIGGKMMEECIEWCKNHEIEQMELEVVCKNKTALNMYRSFGFEISGIVPHALKYNDNTYVDEYFMVKYLGTHDEGKGL